MALPSGKPEILTLFNTTQILFLRSTIFFFFFKFCHLLGFQCVLAFSKRQIFHVQLGFSLETRIQIITHTWNTSKFCRISFRSRETHKGNVRYWNERDDLHEECLKTIRSNWKHCYSEEKYKKKTIATNDGLLLSFSVIWNENENSCFVFQSALSFCISCT